MKTSQKFLLILSACLLTVAAKSQSKKQINVYYLVDINHKITKTKYFVYRPADLDKLEVVSKTDSVSNDGLPIENVIVSVNLKSKESILNINSLLDQFHIKIDSLSSVELDGKLVADPQSIYGLKDAIYSIKNKDNDVTIVSKMSLERKPLKANEKMIQ